MRILLLIPIYYSLLNAVEITATQNKAYVTQGSIEVSGYGISQIVSKGEITFYGENIAPSKPRLFEESDIQDIKIELEASEEVVEELEVINNGLTTPKYKFIAMGVNG
jgi:hypothetical protein